MVKCDGIPDKPLDSVGQLAVVDNDTKLLHSLHTIIVRDLCISSSSLVKCDGIPDKPLDSVGQLAVVDNDTKLQVKHASTP